VIRETIRSLDKVAIARVVLTNREHIIALEARDKGLIGMLLRYPYEVRDLAEYFDDIQLLPSFLKKSKKAFRLLPQKRRLPAMS
jgi:non-homologous end joining protein Ku